MSDSSSSSDDDVDIHSYRTKHELRSFYASMKERPKSPDFHMVTFHRLYNMYFQIREYPEYFYTCTRTSLRQFDLLRKLVAPNIIVDYHDSSSKTIPNALEIVITLWYLASGDTVEHFALYYEIPTETCLRVFTSVMNAIWISLSPKYLKTPSTPEEFREVAKGFQEVWGLPHCIGAVGCKRMEVQAPSNSPTNSSVSMLAACDANYCFTLVEVARSPIRGDANAILKVELEPDKLIYSNDDFPYFYVGNEACTLTENFLTPFGKGNLEGLEDPANEIKRRVFNFRLGRAQLAAENAFGILSSRFKIFHRDEVDFGPETGELIFKATAVLHNFLMKTRKIGGIKKPLQSGYYGDRYKTSTGKFFAKGMWRSEKNESVLEDLPVFSSAATSVDAIVNRLELTEYLNLKFPLTFQNDFLIKKKH